jgi:hypothetical protein
VGHVFWFTFRDIAYKSLTGAGLVFGDGRAKPAAAAFRFPFVAIRSRHGPVTVWGRAPRVGVVTVQRRAGPGRWRALRELRTTRDGIFYGLVRTGAAGGVLRAREGTVVSPGYDER